MPIKFGQPSARGRDVITCDFCRVLLSLGTLGAGTATGTRRVTITHLLFAGILCIHLLICGGGRHHGIILWPHLPFTTPSPLIPKIENKCWAIPTHGFVAMVYTFVVFSNRKYVRFWEL